MDFQPILTVGLLVSLLANLQLFQDLRSLHDKSQRALQLVIDNCEDQLQEDNIVARKQTHAIERKLAELTVSRLTKSVKKSLKQDKSVKKSLKKE